MKMKERTKPIVRVGSTVKGSLGHDGKVFQQQSEYDEHLYV